MSFDSFNLNPRIAAGVEAFGYTDPTPIQAKAIPPILEGRDVMGLAQTGTGKTAAFALPILQRLMEGPRGQIRALVLAPTRELAEQINDQFEGLGKSTRSRSLTLYGGVSQRPQVEKLRAGVEIVVACPGRLLDLLGQREIDLSRVEVLVLDEADRMMDMGFLPEVRRILKYVPAKRQTLFFSATMPDDIRDLAHDMLHQPVTVQIGQPAPAKTVAHALFPVPQHLKTELLRALLEQTDTDSVLVFTRTKHRAKRLAEQLAKSGYQTACLQGNLSQNRRQAALDDFREGRVQILVATDIAARGIDVTTISHVINYDMPDTAEAYTHRIGRTGRMTKTGDAFTLTTDEDTDMIRAIERVLGYKLERRNLPGFDYKAPAAERTGFERPPRGARPNQQPRRAPAPKPAAPKPAAQSAPPAASASSSSPSSDAWTALRRKDRRRRPDFNHPSGRR